MFDDLINKMDKLLKQYDEIAGSFDDIFAKAEASVDKIENPEHKKMAVEFMKGIKTGETKTEDLLPFLNKLNLV